MWIVALAFLVVFEAIADIFSKEYSLQGTQKYWALATVVYLVANIFWLYSIRNGSGLARGAVLFALGSAIVAIIIGFFMYNEEVGRVELIGILLGILSISLIFWPDLMALIKE